MTRRVLIAMSGGVDSSVTAYLLKQQGYECAGATMRLTCSRAFGDDAPGSCCSLSDLEDAEAVCGRLGIPWQAIDMRETFSHAVVDKFVRTYEAGRTPNPCIDCNRYLKFGALLDYARDHGFDAVATGHYGRVRTLWETCAAQEAVHGGARGAAPGSADPAASASLLAAIARRAGEASDVYTLSCGVDATKDQSYVLYALTQERLAHTLLPLGSLVKERDVRRIAREQGFENAAKRDSQGICFVPDGDFAAYIERRRGRAWPEGDVLDTRGTVIGRHRGAIRYTIGQRKGLGIANAHPLYVTAIDAAANTVTLGAPEDLLAHGLTADDWVWSAPAAIMGELLDETGEAGLAVGAKIRYHHPTRPARLFWDAEGVRLMFDEPERGIAPGQAVVIYAGDVVLGGGRVVRALG